MQSTPVDLAIEASCFEARESVIRETSGAALKTSRRTSVGNDSGLDGDVVDLNGNILVAESLSTRKGVVSPVNLSREDKPNCVFKESAMLCSSCSLQWLMRRSILKPGYPILDKVIKDASIEAGDLFRASAGSAIVQVLKVKEQVMAVSRSSCTSCLRL